jgi:hypothetical protein
MQIFLLWKKWPNVLGYLLHFQKVPEVSNHRKGENSPNLGTLFAGNVITYKYFFFFTVEMKTGCWFFFISKAKKTTALVK